MRGLQRMLWLLLLLLLRKSILGRETLQTGDGTLPRFGLIVERMMVEMWRGKVKYDMIIFRIQVRCVNMTLVKLYNFEV